MISARRARTLRYAMFGVGIFACFFLFGYFAGAQTTEQKQVLKKALGLDSGSLALLISVFVSIQASVELAKKYGFIKTPTDRVVERGEELLNFIMPEKVPLSDTRVYELVKVLENLKSLPDRIEKLEQIAKTNARHVRTTTHIMTFIAERMQTKPEGSPSDSLALLQAKNHLDDE